MSSFKTSYLFIFLATLFLIISFIVYNTYKDAKHEFMVTKNSSELKYVHDFTNNIISNIKELTKSDIYENLKNSTSIKNELESELELFVTSKYKYIYLVDKVNNRYRFLLDGDKNLKEKSEFEEYYNPVELDEWNSVYISKKATYFEHKRVNSLFITYLNPVVINGEVKAILVVDFSIEEHIKMMKRLNSLNDTFKLMFLLFFIIFFIIVWISLLDIKREKIKNGIKEELMILNSSLEQRVKEEVEKNRVQDKMIFQQSRMAQMGEMLSMIAHQWRQPLSAISGASIILQIGTKTKSLDSDEIYNESKKIADIAQHLSDTIDDFRNFFKPNKSKTKTSFSLLIEDVLKILSNSMESKNIRLVQELNSKKEFETYSNEIKQVILNLMINAEDAIVDKSITNGYIKIYSYDENEKSILEISDNAGGIPNEIIEMIFDPYFSTKLEKNGTGLGLYMSKIIVNEHCNGTLEALNKDGGATFRITL